MPTGGDRDPGQLDGVVVTARDIWLSLVDLTREVRDMSAPLKEAGFRLADHEQRIRGLERWRYALPVTLFLAVASILAATVTALWGH